MCNLTSNLHSEQLALEGMPVAAVFRSRIYTCNKTKFKMDFIKKVIENNGPDKSDYHNLKIEIERIGNLLEKNSNSQQHQKLLDLIEPALTLKTVQGFAFQKPHGYAGDFEIIDKIYTQFKSDDESFRRWDEFFHAQEAPCAVRNRKTFFLNILNRATQNKDSIRVLNVGSGPGRDIYEYFNNNPKSKIHFDCIDHDKKAIAYASDLCNQYLDRITFINSNIFKFKTSQKYDLIWSAGIFDYLNDKLFVSLLKKLYSFLGDGGVLYIGNFSNHNPTRKYMEIFGNWHLIHRSKEQLQYLSSLAGIDHINTSILSEPLRINLFLQIFKPDIDTSCQNLYPLKKDA
jgi:extracellular factor (EF) 3-hydroxypalmitic acid methyl ester biosynthesis protein